jgi:hypothetical protein
MTTTVVGQSTGGKLINLSQLEGELHTAGVQTAGLGMGDDLVWMYDQGTAVDFAAADQPTVDQVIADHVAMRPKTDAELSAEFQDPNTTPARKQELRDQMSGLTPREEVPMT